MKKILGVRFGHDAAACLVYEGRIIADVAEERFTRKKNDGSFPVHAIRFCLESAGIKSSDLDAVAVASEYVAPEFAHFFPGLIPLQTTAPVSQDPLPIYMDRFPVAPECRLVPVEHHRAHAASAYYTAGLGRTERALVAVLDGMGDRSSVSIWRGHHNRLEPLASWDVGGSIGRFYSAATEALGWRHGSDEWKLMGLAPYGTARPGLFDRFYPVYGNGELIEARHYAKVHRFPDHGTFHYHMDEAVALRNLLHDVTREDFAAEAQRVAEEQAQALILPWLDREDTRTLCCAGGFFLNVKLNGKLWQSGRIDHHWVYPNPGDSGLPAGAALAVYYEAHPEAEMERLEHLYHGPEFSNEEIRAALEARHIPYTRPADLPGTAARLLAENRILGWFQGRMESGPRALGGRSILMSPLRAENKDIINASVKYREAFRPFCPALLDEKKDDYLVQPRSEPFMITGFDAAPGRRDNIPAVVHVDGSLRPQTVRSEVNPRFYALINAFGNLTNEYVVLNTSFNVKGEPIVCTPSDAIKCFFDTGLEYLAIGDFLVAKPGIA
ncbi:MAG TPA: carbamoyltransferase C-terminal domain-containing protein [Hyphomicrobiaceae bacterium]